MKLQTIYKIYQLDTQHLKHSDSYSRGTERRVCYIETSCKGMQFNSFETEQLALQYLLDNEMTYLDYTILSVIRVVE